MMCCGLCELILLDITHRPAKYKLSGSSAQTFLHHNMRDSADPSSPFLEETNLGQALLALGLAVLTAEVVL